MDHIINKFKFKKLLITGVIIILMITLFYSIEQNIIYQNDFKINKIGYVETSTDIEFLRADIMRFSKQKLLMTGGDEFVENKPLRILITADGYWPLPSYLEEFNVSYLTQINEVNLAKYSKYDVFISDKKQVPSLPPSISRVDYELRDNYRVAVLFVHSDN